MAIVEAHVARSDTLPAPSLHRTTRSPCRPVQTYTGRVPPPFTALKDLRNRTPPVRRRPAGPGACDRQEKPDRLARTADSTDDLADPHMAAPRGPVSGRGQCRHPRSKIEHLSIVGPSSRVNHPPSGFWRRPRPLSGGGVAPCNPPSTDDDATVRIRVRNNLRQFTHRTGIAQVWHAALQSHRT